MWNNLSLMLFASLAALVTVSGCDDRPKESEDSTVKSGNLTVELLNDGVGKVIVRFRNVGTTPLYIIKPLDGSLSNHYTTLMPKYRFTVRDSDNELVRQGCGCNNGGGIWSGTKWPSDYLVKISPGMTVDHHFEIPDYHYIRRDGEYTVSFEYIYEPIKERFDPPKEAWRGRIKAAANITLHLQKNWPPDREGKDKD